jgi:hypothetical protein
MYADNTKIDLGGIEWGGMDWIDVAQNSDRQYGNEPSGSMVYWQVLE